MQHLRDTGRRQTYRRETAEVTRQIIRPEDEPEEARDDAVNTTANCILGSYKNGLGANLDFIHTSVTCQ